jgi:hypothetical protein
LVKFIQFASFAKNSIEPSCSLQNLHHFFINLEEMEKFE